MDMTVDPRCDPLRYLKDRAESYWQDAKALDEAGGHHQRGSP
jgi:hypothetical protein